jgi:stress-induced morphogen
MAISVEELRSLLEAAFPEDVEIDIVDLAGDGDHYQVEIKTAAFAGKTPINQHRMVYDALQGRMGGTLHAMALKTSAK